MKNSIELANVLVVIDMQNDFIDGSLGSEDACKIVDNVVNKIKAYIAGNRPIYYTMDTHECDYLDTFEGKNLPVPHCIKNNYGWKLNDRISELLNNYPNAHIVIKKTFGSFAWSIKNFITDAGIDIKIGISGMNDMRYEKGSIEICGLCTDICVVSNALILRAMYPNTDIYVDSDSCAGTSKETHEAGIIVMSSNQIEIWTSETGDNYIEERA